MDPVVIEVAVNGVTTKDRNPAVADNAEDLAADIVACLAAGASVIHTHAFRSPAERGGPAETAEEYAETFRLVLAERPDANLYPTMSGGANIHERYDHHRILAEEGLIRCGCLDPGSVNLSSFGPDGLPSATDFVYTNSPNDVRYMMALCDEMKIGPSLAIYEPGFMRMVLGYHRAGTLPAGSLAKFYFSGDQGYFGTGAPTFSAPAIPEALELYLAMLGDDDLPWAVTLLGGSILDTPVAVMALERGGHIRVGLEDSPDAESNLALVDQVTQLAAAVGREVATCEQAEALLRLPVRG